MRQRLLALVIVAGLSGCSHVLSYQALESIDRDVPFAAVKADPAAHQGQTLELGGLIIAVETEREGTTLEVMRYSLNHRGEPRRVDEVSGRFLARVDRFLDPELYKPGRFVTLTGTVAGKETREVSGVPYTYPLFTIGEIYLWQKPIGTYDAWVHGYFYYSYPYGYSPYYYDPWGNYWSGSYDYQSSPPYRDDRPSGGWSGSPQQKRDR
jgi:outer membrane lipoprotein